MKTRGLLGALFYFSRVIISLAFRGTPPGYSSLESAVRALSIVVITRPKYVLLIFKYHIVLMLYVGLILLCFFSTTVTNSECFLNYP